MNEHTCTRAECGHSCWLEDGQPTRNISVDHSDAGRVDSEGPCNCELHELDD